ncbi:hypothetical protein BU17DRAFT_93829 [Hysterangium stoloniferum]|nr:hypothetical protein BU17DRAFT_93829 [Hysterangium stoloniferum]
MSIPLQVPRRGIAPDSDLMFGSDSEPVLGKAVFIIIWDEGMSEGRSVCLVLLKFSMGKERACDLKPTYRRPILNVWTTVDSLIIHTVVWKRQGMVMGEYEAQGSTDAANTEILWVLRESGLPGGMDGMIVWRSEANIRADGTLAIRVTSSKSAKHNVDHRSCSYRIAATSSNDSTGTSRLDAYAICLNIGGVSALFVLQSP